MSTLVKNQRHFLRLLVSIKPLQRKAILQTLSDQQVQAVIQIIYNILEGNCSLPEKDKKKLKRYKAIIRQLVFKGMRMKQRKRLLVKYHFVIAALLKPILHQICPES